MCCGSPKQSIGLHGARSDEEEPDDGSVMIPYESKIFEGRNVVQRHVVTHEVVGVVDVKYLNS